MILFENDGEIDIRAVTTFGVSSKEGDNPIGMFGTGLKYAIAILLREGCDVSIFIGEDLYDFSARPERIRVDDFNTVWMRSYAFAEDEGGDVCAMEPVDTRLGFTTHLGVNWELWQAYRELYCNCIDEGGRVIDEFDDEDLEGEKGKTKVMVEGPKFDAIHRERDEFILNPGSLGNWAMAGEAHGYVRHAGNRIFYRGMRAMETSKPCMLLWNITRETMLTEDRTIRFDFEAKRRICNTIVQAEDEDWIRQLVTADESWFESDLDYTHSTAIAGECFKTVVRQEMEQNPTKVNRSAAAAVKVNVVDILPTQSTVTLSKMNQKRLAKATEFCQDMLGMDPYRYDIIIVDRIDDGIHGLAANRRIYLTTEAIERGTHYLASTLWEEYVHLHHGFKDCSREMQTFLFDKVITLCEELQGEPL